jgi:PGF-pre-PGF domain-containing protein
MQYSNNDTLTNIDARYNNNSGILLTFSNNSILSNLTINGNDNYGIYIGQAASYNTIRNSFIQDNRAYGILLSYSSTPSVNNLFYNNYFNNSVQYFNVSASTTIFFNTTKILGTNIVNRPYIGGNYWAAPNGSGFSQICNDTNGDYICDTAYNVGGLNYDYLPLYTGCIESWSCTSWSTCSGSVQTRTCTDLNSCGITISKPTESQSCNAGGGGTPSRSNPTETQTITSASAGGSASVEIKNPKLDIRNITIYPKTNISNASITVLKNETGDIKIAFPAGTIYQAFTINAKAIKNEDLNNVTIEFRVNKTWLTEQNLSYNQVILYRMPSSTENWEALITISIRGDSKYYYFIAMSSGFSTFIILIKEIPTECIPSQMRCFNDELQLCAENNTWILTEKCQYGCKNQACFKKLFGIFTVDALFYSTIAVVTFGIIIVLYFLFKKVKRARR